MAAKPSSPLPAWQLRGWLSPNGKELTGNRSQRQDIAVMAAPQVITYDRAFTTTSFGEIELTGPVNVRDYSSVNLCIVQLPTTGVSINVTSQMGLFTEAPILADTVDFFRLSANSIVHTYDVIGPEFIVALTQGPPDTSVSIQAWIFLH
jgi:hypothetical protein